jgi:hypothetical protein
MRHRLYNQSGIMLLEYAVRNSKDVDSPEQRRSVYPKDQQGLTYKIPEWSRLALKAPWAAAQFDGDCRF